MSLQASSAAVALPPVTLDRIAAAVSLHPEGEDAARLGAALAAATGADLMLVAIEPELPLVIPGADWRRMRRETESLIGHTREAFAPAARIAIDRDLSIARGLRRVVSFEHRQLLVTGSRRDGPEGQVSLGNHTRQLLHSLPCALAIAARGLHARSDFALRRIGVGFDGGDEAHTALRTAAAIASGCGAELIVRGVVDDRIPPYGWPRMWTGPLMQSWEEVMGDEVASLRTLTERATATMPGVVRSEVQRGRPAGILLDLSTEVDLLVIGSRRWGPMARLLLGGTGEALAHGSRASLVVVPRPATT